MKNKTIWWIVIILWCVFIFVQSNQPGDISSLESNLIVSFINNSLKPLIGSGTPMLSSLIVRKTAHFLEYLILGMLLFKGLFGRRSLKTVFWNSFFIGVFYATTDEIHQFFIPGRAMRFTDVIIDSIGVFAGVNLIRLGYKNKSRT